MIPFDSLYYYDPYITILKYRNRIYVFKYWKIERLQRLEMIIRYVFINWISNTGTEQLIRLNRVIIGSNYEIINFLKYTLYIIKYLNQWVCFNNQSTYNQSLVNKPQKEKSPNQPQSLLASPSGRSQRLDSPKPDDNIDIQLVQTESIFDFYSIVSIDQKIISKPYLKKAISKSNESIRFVKIFNLTHFTLHDKSQFARILNKLESLNHLNVIKTQQYYLQEAMLYITYHNYEGGNLVMAMDRVAHMQQFEVLGIFLQLVAAVNYLHENNIFHGDIKLEHIVFESAHDTIIKLVDFGIPTNFKSVGQQWKPRNILSDYYFKAPEQIKGSGQKKSDIWACGCLLYFLFTSHMPFQGKDVPSLKSCIQRGMVSFNPSEWKGIDKQIQDVISKMLDSNPQNRPNAKDILANPIFKDKSKLSKKPNITIAKNLKQFKASSEAQSATLQYMIDNMMTENEKAELLEEFRKIDLNGDGMLNEAELLNVYLSKAHSEEEARKEVKEIFAKVDKNQSGKIDYNEFVLATVNMKKMLSVERLKRLFTTLDRDHSGKLSRAEFLQLLRDLQLSKEKQIQIQKQMDADGDGEITLEEFFKLMTSI
ncbi:hypothetical protein pb186bvf_002219 [Paramecium bursaria]